jgi:3',5'-cyclic AMP phosphodiesterase CpdA
MSTLKQRFLLFSDVHYTTEETEEEYKKIYPNSITSLAAGNAFGKTQKEKVEKVYSDICEEHRRSPLDAVLVLGDLSLDDYDYRNLPVNYCKRFKNECMDRLPAKAFAIPGNHDSYPNELWKDVFGYDRQYVLEFDNTVFLMADTFASTPASKTDPCGGSVRNPIDDEFLRASLEKYKGKKIFICAHHIDDSLITEEGKRLIEESDDVVFMYRGHVHIHNVLKLKGACESVPLIDIGGYGYTGKVFNGKYDFNVYDYSIAWGYQILEIYDDKIRTYHVKVDNRYVGTNGIFEVKETVHNDIEIPL